MLREKPSGPYQFTPRWLAKHRAPTPTPASAIYRREVSRAYCPANTDGFPCPVHEAERYAERGRHRGDPRFSATPPRSDLSEFVDEVEFND